MSVIDWSTKPYPWRAAGPRFARVVRAIIAGQPMTFEEAFEVVYTCPHCDFCTDSHYSLNAHQNAHRR